MRHGVVFANALSPAVGKRRDGEKNCSCRIEGAPQKEMVQVLHSCIIFYFILSWHLSSGHTFTKRKKQRNIGHNF